MKRRALFALVLLLNLSALLPAQTATGAPAGVGDALAQLEQTAQTTNLDLAKLRIEKWKGGGDVREQYQANADALARNLSDSLPGRIAAVRAKPDNLTTSFQLYRNVDALYDVLSALTDVASGAAPKQDYQALAADVQNLEAVRRALADRLEAMAALHDAELARLRSGGSSAKSAKSGVKKIVIDDAPRTTTRKKKTTTTPQ
jgi:hypothetical protein